MKKVISYLFICSFVFIFISACGNSENGSADEETKISVVLKAFDDPHWRIAEKGAKDAGEDLDVDVDVIAPATESEVEKQVELIDDQLTGNTDGLVLAPSQPDTVVAPLQQYSDSDTPVLLIDSDADYEDKLSLIGTENQEAGRLGGEYISEDIDLEEGDEVAIIRGPEGSTTHDERTKGAQEEMEKAGLDVVAIQSGEADKSKALNVMEDILQSNPDVKAVFTTSGPMSVGAYQVVEDSGKDISVVGFDADPEVLASIEEGGISAIVAQKPYEMGYDGVEKMLEAINGEEIDSRIDTGADIIDEDDAEDLLEEVEGYTD